MINNIAIVGMGALGMMYGNYLKDYAHTDFILDEERYHQYQAITPTINHQEVKLNTVCCKEAKEYDLVLVGVKYNQLNSAIETMKNCIGKDTIIISLMNGIDSERMIGERYGQEHMLYCVAQGMDAVREGRNLTYKHIGVLCIGSIIQDDPHLKTVCQFFDSIGLPYQKEEDILHRLYAKWMLNIGINQTCFVYDIPYGGAFTNQEANDTFRKAMEEVITLSQYEGVNLSYQELEDYMTLISTLDPNGYPSMEQDRKAKRYSEVDMFSKALIEHGKKYHLSFPVNEWLYKRVKEIEEAY